MSHPGPGGVEPSITALVWNANKDTYVKYKALTRIQSPRTEMIDDLYDMMKVSYFPEHFFIGYAEHLIIVIPVP